MMNIGESPDALALARSAGTGAGQNLGRVGINVNLAPVLDVYRQAGDFIDDSSAPTLLTPPRWRTRRRILSAQQRTGVAATAKHFPGLGAATHSQNTDLVPVTLETPRSDSSRRRRGALRHRDRGRGQARYDLVGDLPRARLAHARGTVTGGDPGGAAPATRVSRRNDHRRDRRRRDRAVRQPRQTRSARGLGRSRSDPVRRHQPRPQHAGVGIGARDAMTSALARHQLTVMAARQAAGRILALRAIP